MRVPNQGVRRVARLAVPAQIIKCAHLLPHGVALARPERTVEGSTEAGGARIVDRAFSRPEAVRCDRRVRLLDWFTHTPIL